MGALATHWRRIAVVGLLNSAIPFLCFGYAALSITAGLSSIFNAATPLFGAVIAWLWLKDRLTPSRIAGLAIGFAGVLWLAWDKASFKPGGSGWAIVACLVATLCYGLAANYAKKRLAGVPPLALAAGSQLSATVFLAIPAIVWWPAVMPSQSAWITAALLAIACTGVAYVLYFRLIVLDEGLTPQMVIGCAVILVGTGLTTGVLKLRSRQAVRA